MPTSQDGGVASRTAATRLERISSSSPKRTGAKMAMGSTGTPVLPGIGRKKPMNESLHMTASHKVYGIWMASHKLTRVATLKPVRERPSQRPIRVVAWMIRRVTMLRIPSKLGNAKFKASQHAVTAATIINRPAARRLTFAGLDDEKE